MIRGLIVGGVLLIVVCGLLLWYLDRREQRRHERELEAEKTERKAAEAREALFEDEEL